MRPACLPPRPLAGCRRKQSSIDGDPSFSIHLSLCSTGFHRLPRSYEEIRLLHGRRPVVVASFRPTARIPSLTRGGVPFADPCRPPRVRTLDVLPLPAPIPLRSRLDFGRRVPLHAHPIGPACTGLHLRSVLQRASGFFPTRPHGAKPDCLATPQPACSCLRLAVASNLLRRGLAPPIQGPCLAHKVWPFRPPPSAADGLDSARHPTIVCHQEFDGKERLKCTQVPMLRRPTLDLPLCSDQADRQQ